MVVDDCASLLVDDARIDVRDLFRMGRIGIVENVDAVTAGDERDGAVGKKRDARCELAGALDFDLGEAATSFGSSTHTPYCPTTSAVLLSITVVRPDPDLVRTSVSMAWTCFVLTGSP